METCKTCGGDGVVKSPGWYMVQLREFGEWHDWADEPSLDRAVARAIGCEWGRKARVLSPARRVIWQGIAERYGSETSP